MANLIRRLSGSTEQRYSLDTWINEYLIPSAAFNFNGHNYGGGGTLLNQTYDGHPVERVEATLPGYSRALRACPPAFAAQMVRALVLSQARFAFRNLRQRSTFGTTALSILEQPWTNGTTGELLSRMEWHAGLAGNAYVARVGDRLRVLRPDWTAIIYGSEMEPDMPLHAADATVLGYVYQQGGLIPGNKARIYTFLPGEVAHWSPIPDPEGAGVGMAWITAAIREIQADKAATEHKITFFSNGATPNLVVKGLQAKDATEFEKLVDKLEERHTGLANAYRTLYLSAGADATVVGADLKQLDFKNTQGAGETRISVLSRVPAPLLGISEGLAGSSLNAGNFGMARRMFADTWVYPSLQDVAAALAPLVSVPSGAELWFNTDDIPLLREDAKDAAEIEGTKATTIAALIAAGFDPDSVIAAVQGQNMSLLKHTGLVSVQLQEPGAQPGQMPQPAANGATP